MSIAYNRLYPRFAEIVTPADGTAVSYLALYIGGAGDVNVKLPGQSTATLFSAVPAGSFLPIQVTEVLSTLTTATFIVGLRANE